MIDIEPFKLLHQDIRVAQSHIASHYQFCVTVLLSRLAFDKIGQLVRSDVSRCFCLELEGQGTIWFMGHKFDSDLKWRFIETIHYNPDSTMYFIDKQGTEDIAMIVSLDNDGVEKACPVMVTPKSSGTTARTILTYAPMVP